jgi:hypothetical protein
MYITEGIQYLNPKAANLTKPPRLLSAGAMALRVIKRWQTMSGGGEKWRE